jgi:hypothetical protein
MFLFSLRDVDFRSLAGRFRQVDFGIASTGGQTIPVSYQGSALAMPQIRRNRTPLLGLEMCAALRCSQVTNS